MRVAIISGTPRHNSAYKIEQGLSQYSPRDEYRKVQYKDCVVSLVDGVLTISLVTDGVDLKAYDVIYLHGASNEALRYLIAQYGMIQGVPCLNTESHHTQYINKLVQYLAFARQGIPIPDTYGGYKDALVQLCQGGAISFPVVVKAAEGSNGRDNFVCRTIDDFDQCRTDQLYVLQPFIDNTHDYRLIVAGEEVIYAYKRARLSNDTHLNNISAGGQRDLTVRPPEGLAEIAVNASKAVKREISGVDILVSLEGRPYVLECNFNFGLPDLASIDNQFVEKLHNYITSLPRKSEV